MWMSRSGLNKGRKNPGPAKMVEMKVREQKNMEDVAARSSCMDTPRGRMPVPASSWIA